MRVGCTVRSRSGGLWAALALALAVAGYASEGVGRTSPARYCISIDVTSETAEGLAQRSDAFAREAELAIDASHPLARVSYPPGSGGRYPTDSSAQVVLERMGPRGSILSYRVLSQDPPADLLPRLLEFVSEEISGRYRTTNCDELEGFTAPVLYY